MGKNINAAIAAATLSLASAAATATRMQRPVGGWTADEFTGLGGDYVRDSQTGKRSRAVPEATATTAETVPAASPAAE